MVRSYGAKAKAKTLLHFAFVVIAVPPRARLAEDDDCCTERYHKPPETTRATADRPCRLLWWTLAQAHAGDLGSGKTGCSSWFRCDTAGQIDVRAWGFQLRGVCGKLDGPGVAPKR
jgi:hypothetical protein